MYFRSSILVVIASVALSLFFFDGFSSVQPSFATIAHSFARWRQSYSLQMSTTNLPRWRRIRISNEDDDTRLYSLIMDYLENPALAHSVKELVIRRAIPDGCYLTKPEQQIDNEEARDVSRHSVLFEAIKSLDVGDAAGDWVRALSWMSPELVEARAAQDDWNAQSFHDHQNAVFGNYAAAVLITLCPNIEKLTLEDGGMMDVVATLLQKNNFGLLRERYLQKLKHVKILPTTDIILGDERFYTHTDFLGLVGLFNKLPSLESISVGGIQEDHEGSDRWLIAPHTSTVKNIEITHTDFSSAILASIIRLPKALEEFTYSTGGRAILDGSPMVYPKTLGKSLLCQKDSLRSLDLDIDARIYAMPASYGDEDGIDPDEPWDLDSVSHLRDEFFLLNEADSSGPLFPSELPNTRDYNGTLGSLHDFTALTHLSIGVKLLLGPDEATPFRLIDALPPNLESLVLRGYQRGENQNYDNQIDELLHLQPERLPLLKEIKGIDATIPSGEDVDDPDDEEALWAPSENDDSWEEDWLPSLMPQS